MKKKELLKNVLKETIKSKDDYRSDTMMSASMGKLNNKLYINVQFPIVERYNQTQGTGECSGTGCSESSGNGVTDWADIECGDSSVSGSVKCPT